MSDALATTTCTLKFGVGDDANSIDVDVVNVVVTGEVPASIAKDDDGHAARIRKETKRLGDAAEEAKAAREIRMSDVRSKTKGSRGIVAGYKALRAETARLPMLFGGLQEAAGSCGCSGMMRGEYCPTAHASDAAQYFSCVNIARTLGDGRWGSERCARSVAVTRDGVQLTRWRR